MFRAKRKTKTKKKARIREPSEEESKRVIFEKRKIREESIESSLVLLLLWLFVISLVWGGFDQGNDSDSVMESLTGDMQLCICPRIYIRYKFVEIRFYINLRLPAIIIYISNYYLITKNKTSIKKYKKSIFLTKKKSE